MKRDILQEADYRFNLDRALYVNRAAKKAFSLAFIDDAPEEELIQRIGENTGGDESTFYFNDVPSEGVKRELERVLG